MNPFSFLVDNLMIPILEFFFGITNNYVLAIILLTLTIKMALFPFTIKQVRSMAEMKKIQPKLKEVQKKYKDNPKQMQAQTMSLYKDNGVNPFGSCLPTLIQLPFFIAIFMSLNSEAFKVLMAAAEPAQVTFLWIKDLIAPDPIYILPVLVAISTWLSQKTMTVAGDPNDPTQKIFKYMPFMMLFIAFNMPTGVLIYWALSQLITGAQQYWLTKKREEIADVIEVTPVKEEKKTKNNKAKKGAK